MKVVLLCIGKTDEKAAIQWMETYEKRIPKYIDFQRIELPDIKNRKSLNQEQQKEKEAELILKKLLPTDKVVLLDENAKQKTSVQFSKSLQNDMNQSVKRLVFVVGGPYGFADSIYQRANEQLSLSKMTFTHQMIRVFLCEQIYRATTIIDGKPYHHQ